MGIPTQITLLFYLNAHAPKPHIKICLISFAKNIATGVTYAGFVISFALGLIFMSQWVRISAAFNCTE